MAQAGVVNAAMYRSILVPVDGSEHSANAVREAARLASGNDARLVFLHVIPPSGRQALREEAEERAWSIIDQAVSIAGHAGAERHIATDGSPSHAILEAPRHGLCDVIVMGARRLGGVRGALLGSQTQKVLEKATVPVLVVH